MIQNCNPSSSGLFLAVYLVTILSNLLIILAVSTDCNLHSPMFFFLSSLSFADICISTTTIPKVLVNIQAQIQSITHTGCLSQVSFVLIFVGLENYLLIVMAYDCYVAICHPLRYTAIMNPHLCVLLDLFSLLFTLAQALLHSLMLLQLSFCTDLDISDFFCELVHVLKLACSDTLINGILLYMVASLFGGIPLAGIIVTYAHIITCVLRIPSVGRRYKAFSTCGSHLSVVSLFYNTTFGVYFSPEVSDSPTNNVVVSVMYSVIPQMLNPFIYSLRNREIKGALGYLIRKLVL